MMSYPFNAELQCTDIPISVFILKNKKSLSKETLIYFKDKKNKSLSFKVL